MSLGLFGGANKSSHLHFRFDKINQTQTSEKLIKCWNVANFLMVLKEMMRFCSHAGNVQKVFGNYQSRQNNTFSCVLFTLNSNEKAQKPQAREQVSQVMSIKHICIVMFFSFLFFSFYLYSRCYFLLGIFWSSFISKNSS